MARYIDVDKLIAEYDRVHIGPPGGARKLMEEASTADVVEVKHGKWLPQIVLGQRAWDCSECKTLGSPQWKWCPVCGAKMDGKRRDT